jgi:hypothetical protein
LDYDNIFSVNIYYDDQSGKSIPELIKIVGNKYSQWVESKGKYICFGLDENYCFKSLKNVYKEIEIQWNKMQQIYK